MARRTVNRSSHKPIALEAISYPSRSISLVTPKTPLREFRGSALFTSLCTFMSLTLLFSKHTRRALHTHTQRYRHYSWLTSLVSRPAAAATFFSLFHSSALLRHRVFSPSSPAGEIRKRKRTLRREFSAGVSATVFLIFFFRSVASLAGKNGCL